MPSWRSISASVAGTSHVARGLPCQDSHAVKTLESGDLVIAVADGCGSSKRSDEGSRSAVEVSTQFIAERLQREHPATAEECTALLESALREASTALQQLALPESDVNEVATTLLLTLVTDQWLATAQIGDGAIVCRSRTGELTVVSNSPRGEYVNETTYLTSPTYESHVHKTTLPSSDVTGIAMFTDGVEFLALRYLDNTAHEPFFSTMFDFALNPTSTPEDLQQFLASDRVCERTDDDKTLVLAVRHEPD